MSIDNICKEFGPRSDVKNFELDLDPKCLTLIKNCTKKSCRGCHKSRQNYPKSMQRFFFFAEYKMVIRSAKLHHQGLYQCFAESQAGVQYATMRVDVNNNKMDTGGL